jgi:hypothetical protein
MIHVEKLFIKGLDKEPSIAFVAKGQTFIEYLNGIDLDVTYNKKPWVYHNINLSKHINTALLQQLPNIKLGTYFGKTGIDLDQLLLNPPDIDNLVIELPIDYLPLISKQRLKLLLENFNVMLNDFEEFCTTYGIHRPHIVTYLTERSIKPKCLFLCGAPFQMSKEFETLNIYSIPFEYWLLVTVSVQDYFLNAVFSFDHKQQLLQQLGTPNYFCAIPMFKPRKHRLELLTHLDQLDVLHKCDWSFGFNGGKKFNDAVLHPRKDARKSDQLMENITPEEHEFLKKYTFPKQLDFKEIWNLASSPYSTHPTITTVEWLNRYKFIVSSETYMGNEIENIMGGCATITEKTFKSFLYGASPIVHGGKGSIEHLTQLGFKTQFGNYDCSDVREVGKILLEAAQDPQPDNDIVHHNFDRITSFDFLSQLVFAPLQKIDDLINSIRR